ncbi:MAG: hypothetical protein DIZ80_09365 [endosymbiont of Galathealinum brachiosum]|uniref:Bifunctional diguanylate cyclase/phosphodiesterase n=1 Tax=endosymbiont of Galathealinum brachiosum TaxID=2200906 RepID=A0A370DE95_9GAMM|nr:MAG: hypothetical protein DIZ80_09365 [endosymbiont of Galathealinum brachiosum]
MNESDLKARLIYSEEALDLVRKTLGELGNEFDLDIVLQNIAVRAKDLIQAKTILLPITDESGETYTYRAGAGENIDEILGETMPLNYGIYDWVMKNKKAWWHEVIPTLSKEEQDHWKKNDTIMWVPLQVKNKFLGGIAGQYRIDGKPFNRRDLNQLSLFANIVSIVLENAISVRQIEAVHKTNTDHLLNLERLNKRLSDSKESFEHLSLYDTLTDLPNRSLFKDRFNQQINHAQKNNQCVSILLIDLNDFKQINDTFGHEGGDQLLKLLTKRLSSYLEQNDSLSRLGGDEFALLLPEGGYDEAVNAASRLLALFEKPFTLKAEINNGKGAKDGNLITTHASIGIAIFPDHGCDTSALLRHADHAMYLAKKSKSGFKVYDPEEDKSSLVQVTIISELHKALDKNEFALYYQPKLNIQTGKLAGVEALTRWPRGNQAMTPPSIFIPSLEHTGLINRFTDWVIQEALSQIQRWKKLNYEIKIAVNISTQTLVSQDFIHTLQTHLSDNPLRHQLLFEITENVFLPDYECIVGVIGLIRSMGVNLSIDDFGTGYSSLSRLKKLPVSELKIDQSFVCDMDTNSDDEAIVLSTIDLAHNLGLSVVAEGVETRNVYKKLIDMGCDTVQGYLISKPLHEEAFNAFLNENFDKSRTYQKNKKY